LQVFALVLENMKDFRKKKGYTLQAWKTQLKKLHEECEGDEEKYKKKEQMLRNKEVKELLFNEFLRITDNAKNNNQSITSFFKPKDPNAKPKVK